MTIKKKAPRKPPVEKTSGEPIALPEVIGKDLAVDVSPPAGSGPKPDAAFPVVGISRSVLVSS